MFPYLHHYVALALLVLVLGGIAFHLLSVCAALKFGLSCPETRSDWPSITVLKPVRGVDADAYENYASFCCQDYPDYEVLFGVQDPDDPALEVLRRVQRDFPATRIKILVSAERVGPNLKICTLRNLMAVAAHPLLVISDSDMRVRQDYLRQIAAYFRDPQVGLVTSPYRALGARSVSAGLESLGMATEFFPGVAIASQFAAPEFAFGSTMALNQETLQAIGGFEELAQYLADDYQIGHRVAALGQRVALSRYVVDTILPNVGFGAMFARRLRWTRTVRVSRPWGFAGSAITHSTIWAAGLAVLCGRHPWALELLAVQQVVRTSSALLIGRGVLGDRDLPRWLWLLPTSDLLNFALWTGSWFGNTVLWRGERYRLTHAGRMVRVSKGAPLTELSVPHRGSGT